MNALLLLVLVLMVVFFMFKNNVRVQLRKKWMNNKIHYVLFAVYIAFLLIALIVSEVMATKNAIAPPPRVANYYDVHIDNAILSGESVDPSLIIEKRTHLVPRMLKIQNSTSGTYIYIERKKENDGIIEEILYKPMLYVLDYDLSDEVTVSKPIWNDNIVNIIPSEKNDINYVSYHDAKITNQLTTSGFQDYSGHHSTFRSLVIHLIVPKDLIIESIYPEFVHFIDE